MHAVKDGPANRSFGLQVAALAGLPKGVIAQAGRNLAALERQHAAADRSALISRTNDVSPQLGLFAPQPSAAEDALRALEPDTLSPRDALEALCRLKKLV
jgi:DNA mismatch repair protein MutS